MQRLLSVPLLLILSLCAQAAPAKLKVVATIPDIGNLVQIVGGDKVEVTTICSGTENVHAVRLKPSHIVAVSRCDLFCQVGLSLEHAWVPGLLQTARNAKVQPGQPGHLTVSDGMPALDVPSDLSRQNGADLHPDGNPHINLAQGAGRHMAQRILATLSELDPADKALFEANYKKFESASLAAEARWKRLGDRLKGQQCVVYHTEFTYLLRGLGIETIATIEPKPGVPPTPGHLAEVIQTVQSAVSNHPGAKIPVITAAWSNNSSVDRIVESSPQCTKCLLASMVPKGKTWLDTMEDLHKRLAEAYGVPYPDPEPEAEPAPAETH
ncbi:MAG TPA: metal ABC transporter substrate-binding protein [Planctomycetota bacterium]|nr:zinc ABC transporter substrate-binding protein [Planctomycetota bacterium]HPF13770.1 metal ABC transporter substrate-binding protein [Planctomycetota bacterium]HRV81364.1 metal ABC transporter substrate-binding protein [Planctomycetota bacterium]